MILRRLEYKLANFVILGGVFLLGFRIWGKVLSPLIGGSESANIMSRVLCPSTMLRAVLSTSSL